MKKQTAAEWYHEGLNEINLKLQSGLINYEQCKVEMKLLRQKAKAMEKEHILEAFLESLGMKHNEKWRNMLKEQAEQYYNETFKSE